MAATNTTNFSLTIARGQSFAWDLAEALLGFGAILLVLWLPTPEQLIFGPIVLLAPLAIVLWNRPSLQELGLRWSQLLRSLWILPAALGLMIGGMLIAERIGTFHPLYGRDLTHVGGYLLWTIYQQFLLQDYFMPRLTRALGSDWAVALSALLFAAAHLPNLSLTLATLAWGAVSCLLFRRYRSLYVLGVAQCLLGLCFSVCVPDAMHHHMRVGLGYLRYHGSDAGHYNAYHGTPGE